MSRFTEAELLTFCERVRAERLAAGLPATISDTDTLDTIASLIIAKAVR